MTGPWKMGVEIELLAPRGSSREALGRALAGRVGGSCRRFLHPQAEPSKVPGKPVFENLTQGFEVRRADGSLLCKLVDDVTIQDDLQKNAPPLPGWFRIVSDDARLLRLLARQADPEAELIEVLRPFAALFGREPVAGPGGMWRVSDEQDASLCIGAPLPGERERPCEVITAPLTDDRADVLGLIYDVALGLGFSAPAEGATHLHFDAAPLCKAKVLQRLVKRLQADGPALRAEMKTNPRCRRLGPFPEPILALARDPAFGALPWEAAKSKLKAANPTKYLDYNLRNIAMDTPGKHTFEVRILPVWGDAASVLRAADRFEGILREAVG